MVDATEHLMWKCNMYTEEKAKLERKIGNTEEGDIKNSKNGF